MPKVSISPRFKRGTPESWLAKDPILEVGEPGYELRTGKLKIGDGETPWSGLEYFNPGENVAPLPPDGGASDAAVWAHINSATPHPIYDNDNGPSLLLLYQNAKV